MRTILFFNNKGGVGKTTLVYHLACMLSGLGYKTLTVDLDPQANLTSMFLDEESLLKIYENDEERPTILKSIQSLTKGLGDISDAAIETINENLFLLPGDLELSAFDDKLSENWNKCLNKDEFAFRITSSFYRIIQNAHSKHNFDVILIDTAPNLGAINRAIFISADYFVVPTTADLISLQGLKNFGNTLAHWKEEWHERLQHNPAPPLNLPKGKAQAVGYIVVQQVAFGKSVLASKKWAERISFVFRKFVLREEISENTAEIDEEYNFALIRHYKSLMGMAQEVRKPMFLLKPADGVIGAHFNAVKDVYKDFKKLAENILNKCS